MKRFAHLLLLVAGTLAASAAEKIAEAKAKSAEPVVEELMGGCSLNCAFPWTVEAQPGAGGKAKITTLLNDESAQTAWIAPEPTTGIGSRFRLIFPKKLARELEGATPVFGLDLINGYWKTEELWDQHGRIKKARLYYNNQPFRDVTFADSQRWQRVTFPDFFVKSGDSMTIEVLEIYPGKSAGLALSELVLQGGH
jgi:hypothetical protein